VDRGPEGGCGPWVQTAGLDGGSGSWPGRYPSSLGAFRDSRSAKVPVRDF
jgi:hypothetical protein